MRRGATAGSARLELRGWGGHPVALSDVLRPERPSLLPPMLARVDSAIARGLGRSYGDASFNGAGATLAMDRCDRLLGFDADTGALRAESGVSLGALLRVFLARGFVPPVLPGTQHVTLGGAVAADIHGKNHHRDGAFGRHVLELLVLLASGEPVRCSRSVRPELFWATIGGMGLTGVIAEVTLRLRRVPGTRLAVDTDPVRDLDEALELLTHGDAGHEYSVAWVDLCASRRRRGSGVVIRGNWETTHAPLADTRALELPLEPPVRLLRLPMVRVMNAAYRLGHPRRRGVSEPPARFFFPLDGVGRWNLAYGRAGFAQYQLVVPDVRGLRRIVAHIAGAAELPFLCVLKRFGDGEPEQLLSFPRAGYTLALDYPWTPGLPALLDALDALVLEHGGNVYLAKDSRLARATFERMVPALDRWRAVRASVDPSRKLQSDLARRLGL